MPIFRREDRANAVAGCRSLHLDLSGEAIPKTLIIGLVGGWPTPLKNMKVSWDDYSQYMEK